MRFTQRFHTIKKIGYVLVFVYFLSSMVFIMTTVNKKPETKTVNKMSLYISNGRYNLTNFTRPIKTKTLYPLTQSRNYLLNNVNICQNADTISVLFVVHSAFKNFEARRNIRNTFTRSNSYLPEQIRVIFLVGTNTNGSEQRTILKEFQTHGDIIQGNFTDTYHNLTHKAVLWLRWVYENCQHVKYVVKLDDDVVFDTKFFLEKMYKQYSHTKKTLWCNVCPHSPIYREGKWKVDANQFKGYKRWPWKYCAGFVVLITSDLLISLYQASLASPFFWVDDVYTFGILSSRIGGVTFKSFPSTSHLQESFNIGLKCLGTSTKCNVLAVGAKSSAGFKQVWKLMTRRFSNQSLVTKKKRSVSSIPKLFLSTIHNRR